MYRGLFITGTDTGVGKTRVTAGIAAALRLPPAWPRAERFGALAPSDAVGVWKPVQTGAASPSAREADSWRLAEEGRLTQTAESIAGLTYPAPLAPWMAARRQGEVVDYAALLDDGKRRQAACGFLLVEGAGGLAVPLTATKLMAHLAADLDLPLLIVARAGLGTVNHTLLTAALARQYGLIVAGVVLNETVPGDAEPQRLEENAEMIEAFGDVPVIGKLPYTEWAGEGGTSEWAAIVKRELDWPALLGG
ncbi:dethiobiotin synthase [Paenibacillus hodogayensis]|uniref:ATP-dependent dethiobiotin synthetase BioD n=1 Tax=Paenibacillus hodogayensis TaxID=279208 RepID=A0ABV5W6V9_9BACL